MTRKEIEKEFCAFYGVKDSAYVSKDKCVRDIVYLKKHIHAVLTELYCSNPHHPLFEGQPIDDLRKERIKRICEPEQYVGRYVR